MRIVRSAAPPRAKRRVGVADRAVAMGESILSTAGLGSCIGVVYHDPEAKVGGLAHPMLPYIDEGRDDNVNKYVDTAAKGLYEDTIEAGASPQRLTARIVGGSEMLSINRDGDSIGSRNASASYEILSELGVKLAASDVGGERGRSISLDTETGVLTVRTADGTYTL